jgi:DNA-binding MarR family transcriptional regulator
MTRVSAESAPPEAVAVLVAKLRRAMRKAAPARTPGMPLSVAQLELLSLVEEHPGARPGDLASLLRLAASSVSTLTNAMVSVVMLYCSPGARGKRTVEYTSTPRGAQLVGQWRTVNEGLLLSDLAALGAQARRVLNETLQVWERLVAAIDDQAQTPTHTQDTGNESRTTLMAARLEVDPLPELLAHVGDARLRRSAPPSPN